MTKYIVTLAIETDQKVTKQGLRAWMQRAADEHREEYVEYDRQGEGWSGIVTKARVRSVDLD